MTKHISFHYRVCNQFFDVLMTLDLIHYFDYRLLSYLWFHKGKPTDKESS
jgi:hypothetical protein